MSMFDKSLVQSKTFWFNLFMTLIDVSVFLETFNAVPGFDFPQWVGVAAAITHGVGNVILRVWFHSEKEITKII